MKCSTKKSDIKGFVCIFVIVDSLTRLLPGLFMMIVLWPNYALFYRIQMEYPKPFYIAFLPSSAEAQAQAQLGLSLLFSQLIQPPPPPPDRESCFSAPAN